VEGRERRTGGERGTGRENERGSERRREKYPLNLSSPIPFGSGGDRLSPPAVQTGSDDMFAMCMNTPKTTWTSTIIIPKLFVEN
jgi:hypothetical protein